MNQAVDNPTPWRRGFWFLMATQCQNAFSDNALKNLVILLVLSRPMSQSERDNAVALASALFALPFITFSMFGGWLADRFSKQRVMAWVKVAEVFIMLFAALALGLHSLPLQLGAVFLMGCHSAFFGPSKYGILPEVLPIEKLSWGNGILELLTFVGIILGTLTGGVLAGRFVERPWMSGVLLACLALAGWAASNLIPKVPAANPHRPLQLNPARDLFVQMRKMAPDSLLWRANLGNTGFFFIAALVQMNLVLFAHDVLHLSESKNALLNAALAIGIGIGSVIAGYASHGKIEYRLVTVGSVVMALSTLPMGLETVNAETFAGMLLLLGFGAGLFIVPVCAVLQNRPAPGDKGAVQGAASVLSFVGILASSGVQRILHAALSSGKIFWLCGAFAIALGIYVRGGKQAPPDCGDGLRNPE
jgi:acyl-[acyl-carrier-protein]-phospholipid O-acyltransferase/long-chain-fatty-acid--[acyl-carrier-protein] ligase